MHMPKLTHRTQILLDDERYRRLQRQSELTRRSMGSLVREAIDYRFPGASMTKEEAVDAILNAEPMEVDDWPKMKEEMLEGLWGKHLDIVPEADNADPSGS